MKRNYLIVICTSIFILMYTKGCTEFIDPVYIGNEEDEDVWANNH